jgi:hypothetical protein
MGFGAVNRVPRTPVNPYVVRPIAGSSPSRNVKCFRVIRALILFGQRMRRSLIIALLSALLAAAPISAQILERVMVPRGQIRLQAYPSYTSWDSRFGRAADGTERVEALGDDLTDPTALSLFPGITSLRNEIESLSGSGFSPVLGSSEGRFTQDITRIDFGLHVGVFDWLTVGAVFPWVNPRTVVDHYFVPDSINGNLGLNPRITNGAGVDAFLASIGLAEQAALGNASTVCGAGAGAACDAAQALAARAGAFNASLQSAYTASPFFPITGSATAASLDAAAAALSADLVAAGLAGLGASMAFATDWLTTEEFASLPARSGAGIDALRLQSLNGLWAAGDLEVSALVQLLDNLTPVPNERLPGFGYRVTAGFLARLPTGLQEDPDILLDKPTGDAQTDFEGSLIARLRLGSHFALAAGARYGTQGSTTLTKRVAAPELVFAPALTRQIVTWNPGSYIGIEAAPSLRVTSALSITGQYRYFQKRRDVFELTDPTSTLDPSVLALESGIKAHQIGGGLRYDTVEPWQSGLAGSPMELHVRVLHTFDGSGGHTPESTRVEAGIRLYRRFWGPRR